MRNHCFQSKSEMILRLDNHRPTSFHAIKVIIYSIIIILEFGSLIKAETETDIPVTFGYEENTSLEQEEQIFRNYLTLYGNMSLIGLTGGIGSGKSTACQILIDSGYEVIDSDKIAREVVQPGRHAYHQIIRVFGQSIIDAQGQIDRQKLAAIIFSDEQKRRQLNAVTHPAVYRQIFKQIIRLLIRQERLIFIDLPLLFESGYMVKFLSKIVVVSCTRETQIRRIMARNGYTQEEAERRIAAQMSMEEKCRRADRVLHNEGDLADLRVQVQELLKELVEQRGYWKTRFVFWVTLFGAASVLGFSVYKFIQLFRTF